jgi:hypothetical protein
VKREATKPASAAAKANRGRRDRLSVRARLRRRVAQIGAPRVRTRHPPAKSKGLACTHERPVVGRHTSDAPLSVTGAGEMVAALRRAMQKFRTVLVAELAVCVRWLWFRGLAPMSRHTLKGVRRPRAVDSPGPFQNAWSLR